MGVVIAGGSCPNILVSSSGKWCPGDGIRPRGLTTMTKQPRRAADRIHLMWHDGLSGLLRAKRRWHQYGAFSQSPCLRDTPEVCHLRMCLLFINESKRNTVGFLESVTRLVWRKPMNNRGWLLSLHLRAHEQPLRRSRPLASLSLSPVEASFRGAMFWK